MPIKIIQCNQRVAEVQLICDKCGRIVRTSLVPTEDVEKIVNSNIACWRCREHKP